MTPDGRVPFIGAMAATVYLDHLATTPLLPAAREAMMPFLAGRFGQAGSIHQRGLEAREAVARAREQVAAFVNAASPEDILFTASGTEALNLAIKGLAWHPRRRGAHIVCSAIEHPAVLGAIEFLRREGITCTRVPVDGEGRIDPDNVRAALTDETFLVAVHAANYDVGTIQPVAAIGELAAARGIPLLVEANYAGGWMPLDVQALGADLLTLAPHRFYGPKGVGVLFRNRRARLAPLVHGGTQEGGLRAGIENVPGIVGAGVAAEVAAQELPARIIHTRTLCERLWALLTFGVPRIELNGPPSGTSRLPHHLNVSAAGTEGEGLMLMCDAQGTAIASGTACLLRNLKASPVLAAMGRPVAAAQAAVLISPGKDTTTAEMERFAELFTRMVERLRAMSPDWQTD